MPPLNLPPVPQSPARVPSIAETAARRVAFFVLYPTTTYLGALAGHVLPQFHEKFIKEGKQPAALYLVGALFKGDIDSNSRFVQSQMQFGRTAFHLLNAGQKKRALDEFRRSYGPEGTAKLLQFLHYRGGAVEIKWLHVYTQIYFLSLVFCFFGIYIPTFLSLLNEEFSRNPQLQKQFYELYLHHVAPIG